MVQPFPPASVEARIDGDISGQVAVGNYNVQLGVHGDIVNIVASGQQIRPRPRPTPLSVLPRPFAGLLDRTSEIDAADAALRSATPVEFHGPEGIGKTALLRHLAYQAHTAPFPDGIVSLSAHRKPLADLLQSLFDAFYESDLPLKSTDAQVRHALQDKRALVILDDVGLSRDEVEALMDAAPACTFLLASSARHLWGQGRAVAMRGLPVEDGLALMERELGRSLTAEERPNAQALCADLEGNPLHLLQAAALVREEGLQFSEVASRVRPPSPTAALTRQALASLSEPERRVAAALAALSGAPVHAEHVAALAGIPDTTAALESLIHRAVAQARSPRYTLVDAAGQAVRQILDLTPWMERALAYFTAWAEAHRQAPDRLLEETDPIVQVLEWGAGAGRWAEVLRLGRAVEGALMLGRLWATWRHVLELLHQAALALGDQVAEAWAYHQLGTRALCLGDASTARDSLVRALRLRNALGDRAGAAVTRHNLSILLGPPSPPRRPPSQPAPTPAPAGSTVSAVSLGITETSALLPFVLVALSGMAIILLGSRLRWAPALVTHTPTHTFMVLPSPSSTHTPTVPPTPTPSPVPPPTLSPVPSPTPSIVPSPTSTIRPYPTPWCRCGDRICDRRYPCLEDGYNCAVDCCVCADGICERGYPCREDGTTCTSDCCVCGDGVCEQAPPCYEDCPADCAACQCGDGVCERGSPCGEDGYTCQEDCCTCGDGVCERDEPCLEGVEFPCAADCCLCGDGMCDRNEWCGEDGYECREDCCACGDGVCERESPCEESGYTCTSDCCVCGDGVCEQGPPCYEDCPADCAVCECGDGVCERSSPCEEDGYNCLEDCCTCGDGVCEGNYPCGELGIKGEGACPDDCCTCGDGECVRGYPCREDGYHCPADCCECGDGVCERYAGYSCQEDGYNCGEDCCRCGDGVCERESPCEENGYTCTGDCCVCGDGVCEQGPPCYEDCPDDCAVCECGDGLCERSYPCEEDGYRCPADCCECGDGVCERDPGYRCYEDGYRCPADCCECGDGVCERESPCEESGYTCTSDCCVCGDGVCEPGPECHEDCPDDCAVCECGDGVCERDSPCEEDGYNCLEDCCTCGDGVCEGNYPCGEGASEERPCMVDCAR